MRWVNFKRDMDEFAEKVNQTILHHEFNSYVNSHSGCSATIELIQVLGCKHEVSVRFDVWRAANSDPMCNFTEEEADVRLSLAHDLADILSINIIKWLKKRNLFDNLVEFSEHSFGVFHDPDCIAVESCYWFNFVIDLN